MGQTPGGKKSHSQSAWKLLYFFALCNQKTVYIDNFLLAFRGFFVLFFFYIMTTCGGPLRTLLIMRKGGGVLRPQFQWSGGRVRTLYRTAGLYSAFPASD